jgi:hypothetical protein
METSEEDRQFSVEPLFKGVGFGGWQCGADRCRKGGR